MAGSRGTLRVGRSREALGCCRGRWRKVKGSDRYLGVGGPPRHLGGGRWRWHLTLACGCRRCDLSRPAQRSSGLSRMPVPAPGGGWSSSKCRGGSRCVRGIPGSALCPAAAGRGNGRAQSGQAREGHVCWEQVSPLGPLSRPPPRLPTNSWLALLLGAVCALCPDCF